MNKLMYDIKDLTEVIPFSERTIREMIASGKLRMWRIGRKWVISHEKLMEWIENSEYGGFSKVEFKDLYYLNKTNN
jgi:excisionase family DNA binding protein